MHMLQSSNTSHSDYSAYSDPFHLEPDRFGHNATLLQTDKHLSCSRIIQETTHASMMLRIHWIGASRKRIPCKIDVLNCAILSVLACWRSGTLLHKRCILLHRGCILLHRHCVLLDRGGILPQKRCIQLHGCCILVPRRCIHCTGAIFCCIGAVFGYTSAVFCYTGVCCTGTGDGFCFPSPAEFLLRRLCCRLHKNRLLL